MSSITCLLTCKIAVNTEKWRKLGQSAGIIYRKSAWLRCDQIRKFRVEVICWKLIFNSHGTRRLYPPRNEVAVYCQDIHFGVIRCLCFKSDMNYVILVPEKFASWSKKCHFRSISGEISAEKFFFGKILLHQKIRLWISGGVSWAIFELSCSFSPLSAF